MLALISDCLAAFAALAVVSLALGKILFGDRSRL